MKEDLRHFYERQRLTWPDFDRACQSLSEVKCREIEISGIPYLIQFNPARRQNVEVREENTPCFLCPEQLPTAQEAMAYGDLFSILCNPRPIVPYHFTITARKHERQTISGREEILLDLARDLGPEMAVFYNGPRSGASLPHHFHFQACPFSLLPLSREKRDGKMPEDPHISLVNHSVRGYFALRGTAKKSLASALKGLIHAWKEVAGEREEPMMNIIASFGDGCWVVYLFPRQRHRPRRFFLEDGERVMVTPGAVEMGGLIVTVRERDFLSLNREILTEILTDVCADGETLEQINGRCKIE